MSSIYVGIDLGTDSVKMVVSEKIDDKFIVLASVSEKSQGIKNGQIIEMKLATACVKSVVKKINEMLGIKITKALLAVQPTGCRMDIAIGSLDVLYDEDIVGEDVTRVMRDALVGQVNEEYELITAIPIGFKLDDTENIKDPKGMRGEILETKVVISTLPKEPLYRILEVLKLSGIEVIDLAFTTTGDYYEIKNNSIDNLVGAVINIGCLSTNVSIFNKGIQIKNSLLNVGSKNVDNDISYIFKTSSMESARLKEKFAVANFGDADRNDFEEVVCVGGEKININQLEISEVIEARLLEILKLVKKEIKNLTNREISYIMVTGGITELLGFQNTLDKVFGIKARVLNSSTVGLRHNKYSSVLGLIKYYDDKLTLRDKSCNMLNEDEINKIASSEENKTITNDNIISRVFGHFFDN